MKRTILNLAIISLPSAVIFGSPLRLGSTEPEYLAIWITLLAFSVLSGMMFRTPPRIVVLLSFIAAGLLAWIGITLLQLTLIATPQKLFKYDSIWSKAFFDHDAGNELPSFLVRFESLESIGPQLANFLALLCGVLLGQQKFVANAMLKVFVASGILYGSLGILLMILAPELVFWRQAQSYKGVLLASFSNPNVAAIYLGACATVISVLITRSIAYELSTSSSFRDLLFLLRQRSTLRGLVALVSLSILILSIFLTGSRSGSVLSLFAIVGATSITVARRTETNLILQRRYLTLVSAAGIAASLLLGGRVGYRFLSEGISDSARWDVYSSTVSMILDHPWLGVGIGSFKLIFPYYRGPGISVLGVWEQAHSTILEIAAEQGVPFAAIVAAGWIAIFIRLFYGRGPRHQSSAQIAAFWVALLAVVHSQFDFSLQIPGLSIPIFLLVGAGLANSDSRRSCSHSKGSPTSCTTNASSSRLQF